MFLICSCNEPGLKKETSNNHKFIAEYLFEYEGIKVYRFYDGGRYHYFTSKGESISTQSYRSAKTTHYYDENI